MTEVVSFFGIDLTQLAMITGIVFTVTEWAKAKFPTIFIGEWKTQVVALLASAGIATQLFYPDWTTMAVATILGIVVPSGVHLAIKKK